MNTEAIIHALRLRVAVDVAPPDRFGAAVALHVQAVNALSPADRVVYARQAQGLTRVEAEQVQP